MEEKILLAHGSGGKLMHELVKEKFLTRFKSKALHQLTDAAIVEAGGQRLAFSTDSYVVKPIFFPGGDIGRLALCGTINDLSCMGAEPRYISVGFIIEEGFKISELEKIFDSMRIVEKQSGVEIVAGDLKVVEKGGADQIFINTSGIGLVRDKARLGCRGIRPGDKVIISGNIGDHGIAVISKRKGLGFSSAIKSDCAPLNGIAKKMVESGRVRFMRDPTRGGLAAALNETAQMAGYSIEIEESRLPVSDPVAEACELLGFDPLYVANEGKMLVIVASADAEKILGKIKKDPLGRNARIIGEVKKEKAGKVYLDTKIGGRRLVDMPVAEQLPRIC